MAFALHKSVMELQLYYNQNFLILTADNKVYFTTGWPKIQKASPNLTHNGGKKTPAY